MGTKQSFVTSSLRPLTIVVANKNKKKFKKIMEWCKIIFLFFYPTEKNFVTK
jgi:hypothetical protein